MNLLIVFLSLFFITTIVLTYMWLGGGMVDSSLQGQVQP